MKVQILILWIIFIRQLETIVSSLSCFLCLDLPPGWYLLVKSQQLKHKNNVWHLRKVNKKDTRRMFSDVFSGCKERSLEWNGLKELQNYILCNINFLGLNYLYTKITFSLLHLSRISLSQVFSIVYASVLGYLR